MRTKRRMTTRSEHNRNTRLRVANAAVDKEECLKLGLSQNGYGTTNDGV